MLLTWLSVLCFLLYTFEDQQKVNQVYPSLQGLLCFRGILKCWDPAFRTGKVHGPVRPHHTGSLLVTQLLSYGCYKTSRPIRSTRI